MEDIEKRKQAHVELCLQPESQGTGNLFAHYDLPYKTLPELSLDEIDLTTELLGTHVSQPLLIGSMTGGSQHGKIINTNIAIAAEATKIPLGIGSQRIALEREKAIASFKLVRRHAPTAFIFANMGAVQLNYGRGIDDFKRIVDMVKANGLYLHVNPLQEAIQPEGNTNYRGLTCK